MTIIRDSVIIGGTGELVQWDNTSYNKLCELTLEKGVKKVVFSINYSIDTTNAPSFYIYPFYRTDGSVEHSGSWAADTKSSVLSDGGAGWIYSIIDRGGVQGYTGSADSYVRNVRWLFNNYNTSATLTLHLPENVREVGLVYTTTQPPAAGNYHKIYYLEASQIR